MLMEQFASDHRLVRLRRLAHVLDDGLRVPGTRLRFGLDPILGLIPGVGDAVGAIMSAAILLEAVRLGLSRYALARMALNIVLDTAFGAVPVVGDAFDVAWKSNLRNLAILEDEIAEPATSHENERLYVAALLGVAAVLVAALVVGGGWLSVRLLQWLVSR